MSNFSYLVKNGLVYINLNTKKLSRSIVNHIALKSYFYKNYFYKIAEYSF